MVALFSHYEVEICGPGVEVLFDNSMVVLIRHYGEVICGHDVMILFSLCIVVLLGNCMIVLFRGSACTSDSAEHRMRPLFSRNTDSHIHCSACCWMSYENGRSAVCTILRVWPELYNEYINPPTLRNTAYIPACVRAGYYGDSSALLLKRNCAVCLIGATKEYIGLIWTCIYGYLHEDTQQIHSSHCSVGASEGSGLTARVQFSLW